MKRKLGIIGGSGIYKMDGFQKPKWQNITTPWGKPSDEVLKIKFENEEICFIPRHGRGHKINPSNINFRANIDAMKQLGVTDIISVSAVGSLKENLEPGKFVIVDQFIDRTFSRIKTFFDEEIVAHVSMAKPTSPGLSDCCEAALKKLNIKNQRGGTYVVMEGPQFSTLAESNLYRTWGAYFNPSIAPRPPKEEIPPRSEIMREVLISFLPLFSLIILVLGTILGGLATPAEAAGVGAFGAIVLSYFYKTLKWKNFKESVFLTAKTTAMIMWLFIGSWTFSSVFSYLGGHEVFEHFFKSMDLAPWQFLVITQIIIFLLGWPLEWTEILIIFVPIFLPLVEFFGVNPYFFKARVNLFFR